MNFFKGIPAKRIIIDLCGSVFWALMECYSIVILADLTNTIAQGHGAMMAAVFFFTTFCFVWELSEYMLDIHYEQTVEGIQNYINTYYLNRLSRIKPEVLKANNTGYITGLLSKLSETQRNVYMQVMLFAPIGVVYIVFFAVNLFKYHWSFTVIFLIISFVCIVIKIVTRNLANDRITELVEASSVRNKIHIDAITNINTIQRMQSEDFFTKKLEEQGNVVIKKNKRAMYITEISLCLFKFIGLLFAPAALFVYTLLPAGTITDIPEFASIIGMLTVKLIHTIKGISTAFIRYDKFVSAQAKVDTILIKENERSELYDIKDFSTIELKNVDYSYNIKKVDNENQATIKTIRVQIPEFSVNKGDFVCIYGESGQGKTTLLNLLSKEIENDSVYVDGNIEPRRLSCAFIAQDTEMFDMTLKENLTLGTDISDEKIIYYIQEVGMSEWLYKQPQGLNTLLGERGVFVSTGQRQRLNFVRGLLIQDKEIYLLDEPTSNVDDLTETRMINLLKETLKGKTVIIVTHRPKIMEICDKIYKFENSILRREK